MAKKQESAEELYREAIMEYFRNPAHKGAPRQSQVSQREYNPLCGDDLELFLSINKAEQITKVNYVGDSCAISQACAEMLSEILEGQRLKEVAKLTSKELLKKYGLTKLNPTRQRCALLSFEALKKCLAEFNK